MTENTEQTPDPKEQPKSGSSKFDKYKDMDPKEVLLQADAWLCTCFGVTQKEIEEAIRSGNLKTIDEITAATGAGGGCHGCWWDLEEILEKEAMRRDAEQVMRSIKKFKAPDQNSPNKESS